MATEEAKKKNMLRLANLALFGVTKGLWDLVGESAFALSSTIGDAVLSLMEKEMGLEIAGEKPADVVAEIGRLFVDEFGIASKIDVKEGDSQITLHVNNCLNLSLTRRLAEAGVEKPFICPIANAAQTALRRMGVKARLDVATWPEGSGSIITLDLL